MTLPTKSFSLDDHGRLRINRAGSVVKHAQFSIGTTEVELAAGLANRRMLIIKPVRSGTDPERARRWIEIGPGGFASDQGTPIWEEFELVLQVGFGEAIFAKKGDAETGNIDVRILEIGEE